MLEERGLRDGPSRQGIFMPATGAPPCAPAALWPSTD